MISAMESNAAMVITTKGSTMNHIADNWKGQALAVGVSSSKWTRTLKPCTAAESTSRMTQQRSNRSRSQKLLSQKRKLPSRELMISAMGSNAAMVTTTNGSTMNHIADNWKGQALAVGVSSSKWTRTLKPCTAAESISRMTQQRSNRSRSQKLLSLNKSQL